MLLGNSLTKDSTLGIIAPSSSYDRTRTLSCINNFKQMGFNVRLGKHLFDKYSYLGSTNMNRAKDINDMFMDKKVDGIICLRGGYGSILTLPYINTNIIKQNPKFFCGYSDITVLLNYFSELGIPTFHGPMISSDFNDSLTSKSLFDIITFNKSFYTFDLNDINNLKLINCTKNFEGKIIGGNLSMICSTIGTPYELNFDNSILILEEINEPPYKFDRLLTQLISNNRINKCNGIIAGYLDKKSSKFYDLLDNILIQKIMPFNIPIILNFPFGHDYPNLTIPIGINAKYDYYNKKLIILDQFLK